MPNQRSRQDAQTRGQILTQFAWAPDLTSRGIGVTVDDGLVVLSGQVATYPEKLAAEQAARRVYGVNAMRDELTVDAARGADRDAKLAYEATTALAHAVDIPAGCITVGVHDGVVTLSGNVAWEFQRAAAQRAVAYLNGVERINVTILIRPDAPAVGITNAIDAALVRNAGLREEDIVATARRGEVRLSGTVGSLSQAHDASALAWSAPGVKSVENNLTVGARTAKQTTDLASQPSGESAPATSR